MKLLQGRRYLKLMIRQQRFLFAKGITFLIFATLAFMFLRMLLCGIEWSAEDTWPSSSLSPTKNILESKLLMFMVNLSSTLAGLFFVFHIPKCILTSLMSFGMMFALTVYLVLLSFRFRGCYKKRCIKRCRVSSCLWTRRKVF